MPRHDPSQVGKVKPAVIRDSWLALAEFEQELTVEQAEHLHQLIQDHVNAWLRFRIEERTGQSWKKPDASS